MVLEACPSKGAGAVLLGGPSVEADGADFGTSLPGEPSDARQSGMCWAKLLLPLLTAGLLQF